MGRQTFGELRDCSAFPNQPPRLRISRDPAWSGGVVRGSCYSFLHFRPASSPTIRKRSRRDADGVVNIPASGFEEGDTRTRRVMAFDSTERSTSAKWRRGALVERPHFTNVGGSDLVIADVRHLRPHRGQRDWPKAPVHAGESGTITVTLTVKGAAAWGQDRYRYRQHATAHDRAAAQRRSSGATDH